MLLVAGCPAFVNQPPVAIADASPTAGEAPLTVTFDGTGSFDPDGTIVTYTWDFGDGSPTVSAQTASHKYTSEGVYLATLTITDNFGKQGSDKVIIEVGRSSIYYASDRTGDPEIFRMDSDGTNHARITTSFGPDMFPALMPNGRNKLAFASARDTLGSCPNCSFDLFVSEPDGTLPVNLTAVQTLSHEVQPSWSPDGQKIVFASDMDHVGSWYGLYIYDLSADLLITLEVQSGSHALSPAWSPDGQWIAFASDRDGDFEIYKIKPDGTGLTQLTNNTDSDGFRNDWFADFGGLFATGAPFFRGLSWSPDGQKIVFASDANGNFDLFIINADGTGLTQITTHTANDFDPFWLPNGEEIAFVSDRDGGDREIFKLNVNTLAVTGPLTALGTFNVNPARLKP
jgi:Tol biopolymer transport system component